MGDGTDKWWKDQYDSYKERHDEALKKGQLPAGSIFRWQDWQAFKQESQQVGRDNSHYHGHVGRKKTSNTPA